MGTDSAVGKSAGDGLDTSDANAVGPAKEGNHDVCVTKKMDVVVYAVCNRVCWDWGRKGRYTLRLSSGIRSAMVVDGDSRQRGGKRGRNESMMMIDRRAAQSIDNGGKRATTWGQPRGGKRSRGSWKVSCLEIKRHNVINALEKGAHNLQAQI